mgnify:CR=1 FL=1
MKKRRQGEMDKTIFLLVTIIVMIGVIMVYSSSYIQAYYSNRKMYHFFLSNFVYAVIGFIGMLLISKLPYTFYRSDSFVFGSVLTTLLLLLGTLVFGKNINGSTRWIQVGRFTFMPSELAKMVCILYLSKVCSIRKLNINNFINLLIILAVPALFAVLIALQPHISTTITLLVIIAYILIIAGISGRYIAVILGFVSVASISLIVVSSYAKSRILAILSPSITGSKAEVQVLNSLYAISSGGFFGRGLGNSIQKYLYLSASYNDFIFSVYAEEFGFIGSVILILLFFILILRCIQLVKLAPDKFSSLLVCGIVAQIAFQFTVNVAVSLSLMPTTGVPLPFISFGGTSLVISMASMGIVLNVSRYGRRIKISRELQEVKE